MRYQKSLQKYQYWCSNIFQSENQARIGEKHGKLCKLTYFAQIQLNTKIVKSLNQKSSIFKNIQGVYFKTSHLEYLGIKKITKIRKKCILFEQTIGKILFF